MISGLVYTLIGIRFKWLHASLSVAYLGALCVTVLVLHVSLVFVSLEIDLMLKLYRSLVVQSVMLSKAHTLSVLS